MRKIIPKINLKFDYFNKYNNNKNIWWSKIISNFKEKSKKNKFYTENNDKISNYKPEFKFYNNLYKFNNSKLDKNNKNYEVKSKDNNNKE